MNRYQLAALQMMLFHNEMPAKWQGTISKPSCFMEPDIAFHKGGPSALCITGYDTNATESFYVWNMSKIPEHFCATGNL